jgi:hypothetical protein
LVKYYSNGEEVDGIRFPITEINETSTVTLLIVNDLYEDVELIPYTGDSDVQIEEYPKKLHSGQSGKTVWTFSPKKERLERSKEGKQVSLSTLCGFKEILG